MPAVLNIHITFSYNLSISTSCLFSMLSNDDMAEVGKPDGICSLTFVID